MNDCMIQGTTRRNFLHAAPAAAAGISLRHQALSAAQARAHSSTPIVTSAFQLVQAQTIQDGIEALRKRPGNMNLVDSKTLPFSVVLAVEVGYRERQFEGDRVRVRYLTAIAVLDKDGLRLQGPTPPIPTMQCGRPPPVATDHECKDAK